MRDMPIKGGFKIWMLCDTSGYNRWFEIYASKTSTGGEKGLASRMVLSLCHDFAGKNHVFFVDNSFNGYE